MTDVFDLEREAKENLLINELVEEEINYKSVNLQDRTKEGMFFQTVFFMHNGKFKPYVLTQEKKLLEVFSNEAKLREEGVKPKDIREEEKYYYFEYEGTTYRFIVEYLGFKHSSIINHPSKNVLIYIQKKKKFPKSLYDEVKKQIKDYWDFDQDEEYDVQTADVFESFISRGIGRTIYHIFNGIENTGKSTIQRVKTRLQFNSYFGGQNTVALASRLQHLYGIVINQDEFEKMNKDAKQVFIGCANSGFYPDGTYAFTDTNKKEIADQVTILRTFGKRSFSSNSLYGFDKSFISRCHIVTCTRQDRKLKDSINLTDEERSEFQRLTDSMFLYTLENINEIRQDIKETKEELEKGGVFGRETDKNSIILGLVRHFKGEEQKEKVKEYLQNLQGIEDKTVNNNTTDALIMEYLVNQFTEQKKTVTVENKEIVDYIADKQELDDKQRKSKSRSIGHQIKKLKLIQRKTQVIHSNSGRKYELTYEDLVKSLKRFGFNDLQNKLTQDLASQTSQTSQTSQKSEESEESEESEGRLGNNILSKFDYDNPKTISDILKENKELSFEEVQKTVIKGLKNMHLMVFGHSGTEEAYILLEKGVIE